MDPLFSLVKVFFQSKNQVNNEGSIDEFFDNGISFPKIIELLYNIEIPKIHKKPKNIFQKNENNSIALQYLCSKNDFFKKSVPNLNSSLDRSNLLLNILSKFCYNVNIQDIINISKILLKKYPIQNKNDLMNSTYILNLLNILTDNNVKINNNITKANFDEIMTKSFEIAKVPFFINFDSMKNKNQDIFFIQIQLIFEKYSEKINNLTQENNSEEMDEVHKVANIEIDAVIENNSNKNEDAILNENQSNNSLDEIIQICQKSSDDAVDIDIKLIDNKSTKIENGTKVMILNEKSQNDLKHEFNQEDVDITFENTDDNPENNFDEKSSQEANQSIETNENHILFSHLEKFDDDRISHDEDDKEIEYMKTNKLKEKTQENIQENEMKVTFADDIKSPKINQENATKNDIDDLLNNEIKKNRSITIDLNKLKMHEDRQYERDEKTSLIPHRRAISYKHKQTKKNNAENAEESESDSNDVYNEFDDDMDDNNNCSISFKDENIGLLHTINFLAQKIFSSSNLLDKTTINSFEDSYNNDFIPKFVMKFLNIETIENVNLISSLTNSENSLQENIKNIISVINYLKKKENAFKIKIFGFDSSLDREASSILFFRTFLNTFFITKPRNEMKQKCQLFASNLNNLHLYPCNEYYSALGFSTKFLSPTTTKLNKSLYQMYSKALDVLSIPNVFTENQWKEVFQHKIFPDTYYYQLQLIFNEIDSNFIQNHILEVLFNALDKIKKIKIKRFDIITSSIKVKQSFLNLDNQISIASNHENNEIENHSGNNKKDANNNLTPLKYLARNKNLSKEKGNLTKSSEIDIEDADNYWNNPNDNFIWNDGILMKKQTQNETTYDYRELISEINQKYSSVCNQSKETNINNPENSIKTSARQHNFATKLFKLFYYDETKKRWKFDKQSFEDFSADKKIDIGNPSTPLVFFAESNEEDVMKLNSHFLIGQYPKLDNEEQIFIYALCDKSLAMLNVSIDFNDQVKYTIKPIFLLLNIPKSKYNMPDLPIIILQIYVFLFYISDLVIVIINERTFYFQIPSTEFIYKITQKYELNERNSSFNDNDDLNINKNLTMNKTKTMFVIKNESIEFNVKTANLLNGNSKYNKMIDEFIIRPEIDIIDINDFYTYEGFLNKMTNILLDLKSPYSDIKYKFNCLPLVSICSKYINIKITNNKSLIMDMLENRYKMLLSKSSNKKDTQKEVAQLFDEIHMFIPNIDNSFKKEVQRCLVRLRINASQSKEKSYLFELNQSAHLNVKKIEKSLEKKHYISKDQKERIIRNHKLFLQNELLDIIKSSNDSYTVVFSDNDKIINDQFLKDKVKINNIFDQMQNRFIKNKVVQNDPMKYSKKKTNYVLKENENLKEIQVSVEIGNDLNSVIEQDF